MPIKTEASRIGYSEFLLSSQVNYTLTYYAAHKDDISHDKIKRYLENDKLTPSLLWEHVSQEIVFNPNGRLIFDDTVLDKKYSHKIETAYLQYSGNCKKFIQGIGVVTCVYYNPDCDKYWAIDYRIFDKKNDGKSKLDHVSDMLKSAIYSKSLPFESVLMDTWYATINIMYAIHHYEKTFYCPIKMNRLVSCTDKEYHHIPLKELEWSDDDLKFGQLIHLNKMNKDFHVKLFRISGTNRTDFVVTNDSSQNASNAVQKELGMRWKVEELHRELKQVTGIQSCQCRKQRIQRNHIACSFLVWARLKNLAYKSLDTIYAIKQNLLDDYMKAQLRSPVFSMMGFA